MTFSTHILWGGTEWVLSTKLCSLPAQRWTREGTNKPRHPTTAATTTTTTTASSTDTACLLALSRASCDGIECHPVLIRTMNLARIGLIEWLGLSTAVLVEGRELASLRRKSGAFLGHAPGRTNPRLVVPKVSKGALRMDQWTQVPLGTSVKHLLSSFIQLVCEFLYQGMSNETMATPIRIAIKQTYHFSETSSTIHLLHAIHVISEAHDKHMVSPRKCNIKLFHPFCNLGQAKLDNSIWRKAKLNILISEHNRLQISFWP